MNMRTPDVGWAFAVAADEHASGYDTRRALHILRQAILNRVPIAVAVPNDSAGAMLEQALCAMESDTTDHVGQMVAKYAAAIRAALEADRAPRISQERPGFAHHYLDRGDNRCNICGECATHAWHPPYPVEPRTSEPDARPPEYEQPCECGCGGKPRAAQPRAEAPGCNMCGGRLVEIRGRYPHSSERIVCPTCLADRIENAREVLNPQTYEAKAAAPSGADEGEEK